MKYNGTNWETVGSLDFSSNESDFSSIAIDGNGIPYVAYCDFGNSDKGMVVKYNGTNWEIVGSADFSTGFVYDPQIAIDGSGTPYVVYTDKGHDGKVTVMKLLPDNPPAANAGTDQTMIVAETVELDGSCSSDPDDDPLTYSWYFFSKPAGSSSELSSTTNVNPVFVPDLAGDYVIQLVVNDGIVNSTPDQVTITALSPQEANEAFIEHVENMGISHGIENSLTSKLESAIVSLDNGNTTAALNQLNSFINQVEAQRGKKLTNEQADQLIAEAQRIIDAVSAASLTKQSAKKITQNGVPLAYHLEQNYPNPFNPSTVISYELPVKGHVTLKVYDIIGNEIETLVNQEESAGIYRVRFNASQFASGIYFYKLQTNNYVQTRKLDLIK